MKNNKEMTRDDIYDHLAQVYLGKRSNKEDKRNKQFNVWLVINMVITGVIFFSAFYGLTAFLTQKGQSLENKVIFALNNSPIRVTYDLNEPYPPVKSFSITVPPINLSKYTQLNFNIRGLEGHAPGVVKIEIRNKLNEVSAYFLYDIDEDWQHHKISMTEFENITDWSNLSSVSFIFEAWNVDTKKGAVLIDEVHFSS